MSTRQTSLFGPPDAYGGFPRAGRTDPVTSHEAAARVGRSARAKLHREIVLALVTVHQAKTGHELWELATCAQRAELETHNELYRKLNDLRHAGLVVQGEQRQCSVRGVKMVTWLPAPKS